MTVSVPRACRLPCARQPSAGAVLSAALSGAVLSGALAAGPAGAAPSPIVLLGPVAVGQPPLTARAVARNPFLPLTGPAAGAPADGQVRPVLRRGDTGDEVRHVQQALVQRALAQGTATDSGRELVVDGVFGSHTAAAVTAFQSAHGLVADGLVGQRTWDALIPGGGR